MKTLKLKVEPLFHRGEKHFALRFEKNFELISLAKKIGCKWSQTNKCWYLPNNPTNLKLIFSTFKEVAWIDVEKIPFYKKVKSETVKKLPQVKIPPEYEEHLKVRGYAESTVGTYLSFFRKFLIFLNGKPLNEVQEEDIKKFLIHLTDDLKLGSSSQNQAVNAVKFYFEQVLKEKRKRYYIDRPRKGRKLPEVISEQEILRMLAVTKNIKHRCIIALLYSAGLRRSELVNLRKGDIELDRRQIFVRAAKGKKDRKTILSENLIKIMFEYIEAEKPNYWIFEGPKRRKFSASSVGEIVKKAGRLAGIPKKVTPHVLRHSFATHIMDQGVDTRYIQELLGHSSPKTTAIYTHVSNRSLQHIKSPLDNLLSPNSGRDGAPTPPPPLPDKSI